MVFGLFGREQDRSDLGHELRRFQRSVRSQTKAVSQRVRTVRKDLTSRAANLDDRFCREVTQLAQKSGSRVTEEYVRGIVHTFLAAGAAATVLVTLARGTYRIRTAAQIPRRLIGSGRGFTGWVSRVGDGDGLRVFHTPAIRIPFMAKQAAKRSRAGDTISIRLAGVDAPECAHFGLPGQAFGNEARRWLSEYMLGRRVRIVVHSVDQYGRALGSAFSPRGPFSWIARLGERNVSVELARAGYATVYEGSNAQFGNARRKIERAVAAAQRGRRGMWSAKGALETPAEFKRRLKTGKRPAPSTSSSLAALGDTDRPQNIGDIRVRDIVSFGRWLYQALKKLR